MEIHPVVLAQLHCCCKVDKAHTKVECSSLHSDDKKCLDGCGKYYKGYFSDGSIKNSPVPFEVPDEPHPRKEKVEGILIGKLDAAGS